MTRRTVRPLAVVLATIALVSAGCSETPEETGGSGAPTSTSTSSGGSKAVKFSECMREHGVRSFPDPDASGELTIDAVANEAQVDTETPVFDAAISACKDLQPAGFTGRKRSAAEEDYALKFAQCMRENGVEDFPDPEKDGPLIDTNRIPSAAGRGALEIPGFKEATEACASKYEDELGLGGR